MLFVTSTKMTLQPRKAVPPTTAKPKQPPPAPTPTSKPSSPFHLTLNLSTAIASFLPCRLRAIVCASGTVGYVVMKESLLLVRGADDGGAAGLIWITNADQWLVANRKKINTTLPSSSTATSSLKPFTRLLHCNDSTRIHRCLNQLVEEEPATRRGLSRKKKAGLEVCILLPSHCPPGFLNGTPIELETIHISSSSSMTKTHLDSEFMASADMKVLDLTGIHNVATLSDYFAAYCPELETLHLPTPLSSVTTLPSFFLFDCQKLKSLDLSGFVNVTSICRDFLSGCSGLRRLDFSGFGRVTSISNSFLSGCSGLEAAPLDFTPMVSLRSIGRGFMSGCSGLVGAVDLGGLGQIECIPKDFMSECNGLTSINFGVMGSVTKVQEYCLVGCTHLKRVDMRGLVALSTVPTDMLDAYGDCLQLPPHLEKDTTH